MCLPSCTPEQNLLLPTSNTTDSQLIGPRPANSGTATGRDQLRHRLKAASQGLGLASLLLRSGQMEEAEQTIRRLHKGFQLWRKRLESEEMAAAQDRTSDRLPVRDRINCQALMQQPDPELCDSGCI